MNLYSDSSFFLALPVERIINNPQELKRLSHDGWQIFLAEARKRFLVDELLQKNNLPTQHLDGEIIEIDSGISKLDIITAKNGIRLKRYGMYDFSSPDQETFALGTSHTQLEHYPSLEYVDRALVFMASNSMYGMAHQVHAVDDPAFNWDKTHNIRMSASEWEDYFRHWASIHHEEGWEYIGSHRGASGRPKNFILERNGSFPFYSHYNEQAIRKVTAELTAANGISLSRIPLLLLSFSLARNNPYALSAMVGVIHALDAADGYVARKGLGNSPLGPAVDVLSDHIVEAITMYEYAYDKGFISKKVPWILTSRDLSTDILRLYNACKVGFTESHPHEAFGTTGDSGRNARLLYGAIKAIGDVTIPIFPKLGVVASTVHIGASLIRAIPVWTHPTSKQIYRELLQKILTRKVK